MARGVVEVVEEVIEAGTAVLTIGMAKGKEGAEGASMAVVAVEMDTTAEMAGGKVGKANHSKVSFQPEIIPSVVRLPSTEEQQRQH